MVKTGMRFAQLDDSSLERLRQLEETMGTVVLAVTPNVKFADLGDEEVRRIQELEQELNVVLLAYQA